ncbi:hypothetical protein [Clostridium taeniosporum]|uniref:Uncharacterized protein n=1 Tax=Clostridium taeniosporum TaxID=394958 RepID=A0A1D7XIZ5_9CLOT|nr:hypothetical protein [Clostridium taeniosporum]AOR23318.1 hypothetical protein BGI42_06040 [Clostridium taeniosporum]
MQEYMYRKHLRYPIKYLVSIVGFILSIIIETFIISYLRSMQEDFISYFGIALIMILGFLILVIFEFLFLYFIMFRKFKNVSVQLTDLGIVYKNIKGTTFIQYEEIKSIQFPYIKYFGGWTKIKSNKKNIRLTVVLENIEQFMHDLKDILDKKNLSYVYDDKKLYNFRKTATYSDQSWERVYEKIKTISIGYLICMIIAIVYLGFVNYNVSQIIFQLLITLYPLLVFIISEIIFGIKLSKEIKLNKKIITKRNKKFENNVYKYTFIVCGVLNVLILIIWMI